MEKILDKVLRTAPGDPTKFSTDCSTIDNCTYNIIDGDVLKLVITENGVKNMLTLQQNGQYWKAGQYKVQFKESSGDVTTNIPIASKAILQVGAGRKSTQSKYTKSNERVTVKGRARVVYTGPRGGRYILTKGEYISLSKL